MARKVPGNRRASVKEVRELSKLPWVRDDALSDETFQARVLPDGRVLLFLFDGQPGTLYPSREALAEVQRECAEMPKGPIDPAVTCLPPLEEFLRDVEAHARRLGGQIGVADEVLDFSEKSLEAVDKRVWRIPLAKRETRELVTPLVAYVGEVMRRASDGRWSRGPTTQKTQVPVFEPSEAAAYAAYQATFQARVTEALAQGDSPREAERKAKAYLNPSNPGFIFPPPRPIRYEVVEERITGHENEPVVIAHNGNMLQPLALVVGEFFEGGRRGSLAGAVSGTLGAQVGPTRGQPGGAGNPSAS
jgi:hypothetical protein